MRLYDAHNHLQDDRFDGRQDELIADCTAVGMCRMVVNGTRESDWAAVATLAKRHDCVLQVGHIERFNPVFNYLREAAREPRFIE